MLNLFQHNTPTSPVILKQVQDDELGGGDETRIGGGCVRLIQRDEARAAKPSPASTKRRGPYHAGCSRQHRQMPCAPSETFQAGW